MKKMICLYYQSLLWNVSSPSRWTPAPVTINNLDGPLVSTVTGHHRTICPAIFSGTCQFDTPPVAVQAEVYSWKVIRVWDWGN